MPNDKKVHDFTGQGRNVGDLLKAIEALHPNDRLQYGSGDGGGSNMLEKRVDRLESQLDVVQKDLSDIKAALARIETELGHKISYKWLSLYVVGLAALILRGEIASLFAATP